MNYENSIVDFGKVHYEIAAKVVCVDKELATKIFNKAIILSAAEEIPTIADVDELEEWMENYPKFNSKLQLFRSSVTFLLELKERKERADELEQVSMEWVKVDTKPNKEGEYLCFMRDGYIKMCYFQGVWEDMWTTTLKGEVKYWRGLPKIPKD